jgi:hypothetical protein
MSRLTLRLPETLHQQLANLAEGEGVSLNQYIVYALTRQTTLVSVDPNLVKIHNPKGATSAEINETTP